MAWLDLTDVKEQSFEQIKPGSYLIQASECQVKGTMDGTGEYLSVRFMIKDGPYEGRSVFHGFTLKNKNPQAAEIGQSQLKSFLLCAGKKDLKLNSAAEIEGFTAVGHIKIKNDPNYGDKPVISYFKPVEDAPVAGGLTKSKSSPF